MNRYFLLLHVGERLHNLNCVRAGDMGSNLAEVEHDASCVACAGIRKPRMVGPPFNVLFCEPFDAIRPQPLMYTAQVIDCDCIYREPADQRPPLGGHVGDREAGVHGQAGDAGAAELDRGV